jgi:putative membrane-bound dehydrogenase-like protein
MPKNRFARFLIAPALLLGLISGTEGQVTEFDFPIYKNQPLGRQVSGQHAPATTPALPAEEAQKRFKLPEGFEIRLFASEPAVAAPLAMDWDDRGRLWVLELYEYPMGAAKGTTPRDRIKILEDVDGDGIADKVHVWADGLDLGTGLLLGDGGAYVGQAPYLLFLKDTTGDDRADHREVVMTGFGLEDRHELLNGFNWGPDGNLYMTHGVFTHSKVKDPAKPEEEGVIMNAALARWHPYTKKFEVFADGTSNPWGVDFDRHGNAFVSACVIDHLFHMAPGGIYARQAGSPAFPYSYELLRSIVDHRHHMAAYCGVQVYLGDQYPERYLNKIVMGNIHDNSVHLDYLTPKGSSFTASHEKDLLRTDDNWFRPVVQRVGPDGALWITDWYDRYPCYQNARADPEGVDREHGRIWRVVYTGNEKGKPVPSRPSPEMDLARHSSKELVELLKHPNIWHRKQAQRLLRERKDESVRENLIQLLAQGPTIESRLFALWTLHTSELLDEAVLDQFAADQDSSIRAWVARLTGERQTLNSAVQTRLIRLAGDPDPSVRLAVATAVRQYTSGSLTVNTPPRHPDANPGAVLAELIRASHQEPDPVIPFMIWMAGEPRVVQNFEGTLQWFADEGGQYMPLAGTLTAKVMRRICDTGERSNVDIAMKFLDQVAFRNPALASAALDGLLQGQRGRPLLPVRDASQILARLVAHENQQVRERGRQLGTLWGDASALLASYELVLDRTASESARIKAIEAVQGQRTDAARRTLLKLLDQKPSPALAIALIRALGEVGGDEVAGEIIRHWEDLSPGLRNEAANVLVTRPRWASSLLSAIEQRRIPTGDIPATAVRALVNSTADYGMLAKRGAKLFGRVREADQNKQKIIAAKRKVVLTGEPDFQNGRQVAHMACLVCHQFMGEGTDIGPDLTGVGRSSLDALLAHVIDPNEIIGQGYENVIVETKDGRTLAGRLVEQTDTRIKLINVGPTEFTISKDEIASKTVSELSLMPEGLEEMPDQDFRDMIWYILAPPQEGPLTPERRRELIGGSASLDNIQQPTDGESIALWNPLWQVTAPHFEGTPRKHPEFAGRKNVLQIHPFEREKPALLERVADLPDGQTARLSMTVAAHEHPEADWELRVFANGELLKRQMIDNHGERWRTVSVDLDRFAGKRVLLRLENYPNNWNYEFSYWAEVTLEIGETPRRFGLRNAGLPPASSRITVRE